MNRIEVLEKIKCSSAESWYKKAMHKGWEVERILNDLEEIKTAKLSSREIELLLAALNKINLKTILKCFGRKSLRGLQTDISKHLNLYLKQLLDIDRKRLGWYEIATELKANYQRNASETEIMFDSVSCQPEISALEIIEEINNRIINQPNQINRYLSYKRIENLIKDADRRFDLGDYIEAIHHFKSIAINNPYKYFKCLIDIAQCYKCLKAYKDAIKIIIFTIDISFESIGFSREKKFQLARAYHIMGGCYNKISLQNLESALLQQALGYYRNVWVYSSETKETHCLGAWNGMELLLKFNYRAENTNDKYIAKAISWYKSFESIVKTRKSNFYKYKDDILKDRDDILKWLSNEWLIEKLSNIENLLD